MDWGMAVVASLLPSLILLIVGSALYAYASEDNIWGSTCYFPPDHG